MPTPLIEARPCAASAPLPIVALMFWTNVQSNSSSSSDLAVDYLVIGAGAAGMAFTDTLITESSATVAIVDRHHKPGGHWNDAYPFVHLQQDSSHYGANSRALSSGNIDRVGLNQGMRQLASGHEVLHHFEAVMDETLLPSGRVQYFPMSTASTDGTVTSLVTGVQSRVLAEKVVDARYLEARVPSVEGPRFLVEDGVDLVPPNALPLIKSPVESFVVVGAGKTGIDTCIWLLQQGVDPRRITWIVPRDFWIQDRANFQLGDEHLLRFVTSMANQVDVLTRARTPDEALQFLEDAGELRRIDSTVEPSAYHCAVISDGEFEVLRQIKNVIRQGHVQAIRRGSVELEHGNLATDRAAVYVNCTAQGIYRRPVKKIFDGRTITVQWVRTCQPTFSASLIGYVETAISDDETKNHLCQPIAAPDAPVDWLRMMRTNLENQARWEAHPHVKTWLSTARTQSFVSDPAFYSRTRPDVRAQVNRYLQLLAPATEALDRLLSDEVANV